MPKIDKITARIIDLPTIRGHVLSMTTMTVQSLVLVRIDFADGSHGIGEGASIGGLSYGAESCESIISAIVTYIAPAIIGLDGDNVNAAISGDVLNIVAVTSSAGSIQWACKSTTLDDKYLPTNCR